MSKRSLPRRLFSGFWNALTRIRLALSNILFLVVLVLIYLLYFGGGPEPLPDRAALLLNPAGQVVDQRSPVDPLQALFVQPGPASHEVELRDILDAIDYAANDPAITALVLELDNLMSVGVSRSLEISEALERFRETGKPIIARGDYFTQDQYLLASQADSVLMHPLGAVALEGYSSYRNYFSDALDKLSVKVHVFKAGEHKSLGETFLRNDMSEGEKAITERWLTQLWQEFTRRVEQRRQLPAGSVSEYANAYPERLAAQQGDSARTALEAGFVDQLMTHSESNDHVAEIVGARNEEGLYEAVTFERYVSRKRPLQFSASEAPRVAVIVAEGNILPGEQPPGSIGGDTLARQIRETAEQPGVEAIVLRVVTGGGSVFASEVIRQAVLDVQSEGLPVVVSMGAIAASGGYYIAASADRIVATPATLTGSIGVFAALPTVDALLERAGVHTDGVGTTEMAGALRLDRPLNERLAAALTTSVEFTYRQFLQLVAEGRDMSTEAVDAVAQGRVWSAADAREHGLVDELGSLADAVTAAADLAQLSDYEVEHVRPPLSPRDMLLRHLAERVGSVPGWSLDSLRASAALGSPWLGPVREAAELLGSLRDPGHLYMRCLTCGAVP